MSRRSNSNLNSQNWVLIKHNWSLIKGWLEYSPKLIGKIKGADTDRYDRMKVKVSQYAKVSTAVERITDLEVEADKSKSDGNLIATIIVTVLGSFFYARGAYILFSALGTLAFFPALIAGLGASFVVDWLATTALTNRIYSTHKQQVVEQAKQRFKNHKEGSNQEISELKKYFFDEKIFYINDIENISIMIKGIPSNVILALLLNAIEYASALFVINQIFASALEIPFYMQMILGLLPVALTWAAANIKAQSFGLFDYYEKSIKLYQRELLLPFGEEEKEWLEDLEFEDNKLNAGIQILLRETIDENFPTADSAEYKYESNNAQEEQLNYKYDQEEEISERNKKYQEDKTKLDEDWAKEIGRRIGKMRADIKERLRDIENNFDVHGKKQSINDFYDFINKTNFGEAQRKIIRKCQEEKEKEAQKLDDKLNFDINQIKLRYEPMITAYENEMEEAKEKYEAEKEQYQKRENRKKQQRKTEADERQRQEEKRQHEEEIENKNAQALWELNQTINRSFDVEDFGEQDFKEKDVSGEDPWKRD